MHKSKSSGAWEHDFRMKGVPRYHASYGKCTRAVADRMHAVAVALFKSKQLNVIEALRAGVVTIEQLVELREQHLPFVAALPAPSPVVEVAQWPTFGDAVGSYLLALSNNRNKSAGTSHTVALQLGRALKYFDNALRLDAITTKMVTDYQTHLIASGAATNTVTFYVWRLRALYRWHIRQEVIAAREEKRPVRDLFVPMNVEELSRKITARNRYLSANEMQRLLDATPEPLLFPVACGLYAGLRVQEMLHLRPGFDIARSLDALVVQEQPAWTPKTKRSKRDVPINDALRPILENHLKHFASEDWVTPSYMNWSRPMPVNSFWNQFRKIVANAGFITKRSDPNSVSFHTLRHTFASHLAERGVDLFTISKLLGNTVEQVENTYGHLSMDHRRAAVNRLSAVLTLPAETVA